MPTFSKKLKSGEFDKLSKELTQDLQDSYLIIHESILQKIREALDKGFDIDQFDQMFDAITIEYDDKTKTQIEVNKALDFTNLIGGKAIKAAVSRLGKKTGFKGGKVGDLLSSVFSVNMDNIFESATKDIENQFKSKKNQFSKKLIFPELNQSLPSKKVFADQFNYLGSNASQRLKNGIKQDLKKAMQETGVIATRGIASGKIKADLTKRFEQLVRKRMEGYIRIDPKLKNPANIHSMAVSTVRSTINNAKEKYANDFSKKNNLLSAKTWIHNPHLSKVPRPTHSQLNGESIPIGEKFIVSGIYPASNPHDPALPIGEIINCHCELVYEMVESK